MAAQKDFHMLIVPALLRCLSQELRSPCRPHLPASARGIWWQWSRFSSSHVVSETDADRALHFGIVGSGPAGFYTATQVFALGITCGEGRLIRAAPERFCMAACSC